MTHKSNKRFDSEILFRCLLDDGTVLVSDWDDDDDDAADVDAIPEFLFEFGSVFLLSADDLSAEYRRLSVIFLLKQEKQADNNIYKS